MGRFGEGDHWIGNNNERTPMTIEEKADIAAHGISGIVALARDAQQSDSRHPAMQELHVGESLLDIHPTDVQRIMGGIPTEKLRSDVAIQAGKAEAVKFLSTLKSHIDLNPQDRKVFYLRVLGAMVATIQSEDPSSLGTRN